MHEHHQAIASRLKRARGHLGKVIAMLEEGEPCVDTARQLQAVYKAIYNAKQTLVRDHIDHCLGEDAIRTRPAAEIKAEFAEITKYL
ncbi:MAG: metal-sensing transcriptional repressor [Desulfobacterales bacterium]|nr:metal-sensing transcriptional repressor [Desulfobacterales bacterium]